MYVFYAKKRLAILVIFFTFLVAIFKPQIFVEKIELKSLQMNYGVGKCLKIIVQTIFTHNIDKLKRY